MSNRRRLARGVVFGLAVVAGAAGASGGLVDRPGFATPSELRAALGAAADAPRDPESVTDGTAVEGFTVSDVLARVDQATADGADAIAAAASYPGEPGEGTAAPHANLVPLPTAAYLFPSGAIVAAWAARRLGRRRR